VRSSGSSHGNDISSPKNWTFTTQKLSELFAGVPSAVDPGREAGCDVLDALRQFHPPVSVYLGLLSSFQQPGDFISPVDLIARTVARLSYVIRIWLSGYQTRLFRGNGIAPRFVFETNQHTLAY
jgi:hypothetical protein